MIPRSFVVLAAVVLGGAGLVAQTDRIAAEIAKLTSEAPTVLPEGSRAAILSRLERSRTALADGHIFLSLYDLQPGFEGVAGYRVVASLKSEVADHAAFERRWKALGAPPGPSSARAPVLFVEALAQSAEGRAPATYRASLPYAQDAGLEAGLYYLGESHAMVAFASLCRSLALTAAGRRPALNAIEPALARHEAAVVKAYDTAAAAQRPQFPGVNVAIKLARTLDEQQRREGALLQFLVSKYRFGMIQAAARQATLESDIAARIAATKLPAGADHSIGEFFLQLARATSTGPSPVPGSGAVILDDILPTYLSMVKP